MTSDNQFDASGSLAGYLYQCRLALLLGLRELKKKPNSHISIEQFDDIALTELNNVDSLVQAKHHIKPKDLTDTSVDIWKTFRIWIEQFKAGTITGSDTRRIMITTAVAPPGSAMSKLRSECNSEDRAEAFSLLKKAAASSTNKTSEAGRLLFLKLTEQEAAIILESITVMDSSPNLHDVFDEIEGELRIVSPNNADKVAQGLEGWWLTMVAKRLLREEEKEIPVQHIAIKAQELGILFGPEGLPISDPNDLGEKPYHPDDEDELYVRQMRLINLPDTAIRRGVRDFYRSNAQRSRWARENLLLDGEVSKYDAKLKDQWERRFEQECCDAADSEEPLKQTMGRNVFFWANQQQVGFRNVVETWITAGSYHGLADRVSIGWHPEFDKHLGQEGDDGEA